MLRKQNNLGGIVLVRLRIVANTQCLLQKKL